MVFRLPESDKDGPVERKQDDIDLVKEANILENASITRAYIVAKGEDDRVGPLCITLESNLTRQQILKNS